MDSANSQCVISVPDRFQNGSPTTDVSARRSGSAATPRLIGARVGFCLLALALPAAAQSSNAAPPTIVPAALTGSVYTQTLAATGTAPITWSVTSGALPAGLSLGSSTGIISGTPTAPGIFTFTITATNAGGSNSKPLSLTVSAPPTPPSIVTTSPLPSALTGSAYTQTLAATGTAPITWSVTSGALPAGLSLASSTGIISGTPTAAGIFTFTVSANNAGGSNSKSLSLTVSTPVTVLLTPSSVSLLPSQNQTFTATVSGTSNTGVTWSLNPALGGLVSGATTAVYVAPSTAPTTQSVTITATSMADPSKIATAVITLLQAVTVSLSPTTVSLAPSGTQQFTATVLGTSNTAVTWSINPPVGAISSAGLYTAPSSILTSQTVNVTAQSVSNPTKSASNVVWLLPPAPLTITSDGLPTGRKGVPYSGTIAVSGGVPPYALSLANGSLPAGLALNSSTGTISGTPAQVGSLFFTVEVHDNAGAAASDATTLTIAGASYYLATAAAGGSDANNGLSPGAPWLTPNHALNCGDVILAAPSTAYSAANFAQTKWGTVTCPAGNNVAWLKCATFDTCKISGLTNLQNGMEITKSYWGVQGWEIIGNTSSGMCFFTGWHNIHHVVFANNIATGCGLSGIEAGNYGLEGPDYVAFVGNAVYGNSGGSQSCGSGLNVYSPVAQDMLPGTHIYVGGNFSWKNVNGSVCGGTPSSDGEGLIFDTFDGSQTTGLRPYTQQAVADNNLLLANGGRGITVINNLVGAPNNSHIYLRRNTTWGNNTDLNQTTICPCGIGEIIVVNANDEEVLENLAVTNAATGPQGAPIYAYWVTTPTSTTRVYDNVGYSASGTSTAKYDPKNLFSYGPNNLLETNPNFSKPATPGAPNCTGTASVPNCMASVVANFTPTNPAAKGYGYQIPATVPTYDSLFPKWLCNVNLPAGLVTMGCL